MRSLLPWPAPFLRFLFILAAFVPVAAAQNNPGPIQWRYVGYAETAEWWLEFETLPGWNYVIEQSQNLQTWEPMPGGFAYGDGGVKHQFITHGPVPPVPGSQPPPQSSGPTSPPKTVLSFNWTVTLSADPASPTVHLKREASLPDHPAWDTVLDLPLPRPSSTRICFLLDYEDESHFYWNTPTVRIATPQHPQPTDTLPFAGEQEEAELAVFQGIVNQLTAYLSHDQANPNPPDPVPGPHNYVRIRRLLADSNRNGIPDWQELRYGFPVLTEGIDPNADWDGDGILNAVEFATGTNPRIADAAPVHLYSAWHSASLHQCVLTDSPSTPVNSETASNGQHSYSGNGPGTVTPATLNSELDAIWTRAGAQVAGNAPFSPFDVGTASLTAFVNGQYSSGSTSSAFSAYGSSFVSILDGATMRYRLRLHSLRPPPVPVNRHFLTILRKQPNGWNIGNTPPPAAGWFYIQEAIVTRSLQPAAPGAAPAPVSSAEANLFRPAIDPIPDGKQMRNERTLAEISLRADTSRNGIIDARDYHTHQPAVYVVNYNRDEATNDGPIPVEDAIKWKSESDGRHSDGEPLRKLIPTFENWEIKTTENPADLAPRNIAPIAFARPDMKVFLRLPPGQENKVKAFHLYLVKTAANGTKTYQPIWGGCYAGSTAPDSAAAPLATELDPIKFTPSIDITKWINPSAPGYTESRSPSNSGSTHLPYEFVLEGILFRGMPYPSDDPDPDKKGIARYGPSSSPETVFDGVLKIGLEFRAANAPTEPIGGITSWATLTCVPSIPLDANGSPTPYPDLPAFQGSTPEATAQGYAKNALGGRYGHVFTVTNNTDDPNDYGSLRYALSAPVPRTIIFALPEGMDGNISLKSDLWIKDRHCTVAGQTSFRKGSAGICLKNYGLRIDTDDVIVRYIRSRPGRTEDERPINAQGDRYGEGGDTDCITVEGVATKIIIDHCSASFSSDCLLDVTTGQNPNGLFTRSNRVITVQNNLLAWPLDYANHYEVVEGVSTRQKHGFGSLVRGGYGMQVTYWRNLLAHCRTRAPKGAGLRNPLDDPNSLRFDVVNNVVYGWGDKGNTPSTGGNSTSASYDDGSKTAGNPIGKYNYINNYYRGRLPYPFGTKRWFRTKNPNAHAWFSGNRIKIPGMAEADTPVNQYHSNWIEYVEKNGIFYATEATLRATVPAIGFPFGAFAVPTLGAGLAQDRVLEKVGASIKRDALDELLIGLTGRTGEYEDLKGTIIDLPNEVGGWPALRTKTPPVDTDGDGIPDELEPVSPGRNPAWFNDERNASMDDNQDGMTNLEEYLNTLAS